MDFDTPIKNAKSRNAKYIDQKHKLIDVEIEHPEHGWIGVTICQEEYPQTWNNVISGVVAEYSPDITKLDTLARSERRQRLKFGVDPVVSNPLRWGGLTEAEQNEIIEYRQKLLDLTEQDEYPVTIVWPEKPETLN